MIRIGNAGGFWGDRTDAAAELLRQQPDLDYITIDYLAEVSMSILARQRDRDPSLGYAADFLESVRQLGPTWRDRKRSGVRLITNAGGLNPRGCAEACHRVLAEIGCAGMRVAAISGDDVLERIRSSIGGTGQNNELLNNLETGEGLDSILSRLVTANAYLGAEMLVEALRVGADIVITGRVADPSLAVAAAAAHFGWSQTEYDRLAGATVAGHLIECGTQVTGGISTDWLNVPNPAHIGFPVIEMHEDGAFVVTKPAGSGGRVDEFTVKEQLLYEIGDPARYLSPDATVSFLSLRVKDEGNDRVHVSGAMGGPPPDTYKVSATYRAGYRASGTLALFGRDARLKGQKCGDIIRQRLRDRGIEPLGWLVECLGSGDVVPVAGNACPAGEVVLRVSASDERREVVEQFSRELIPLVTAGPQGVTGYFGGRPRVQEVFGYWPCLIERSAVRAEWGMIEVT